MVLYAHSDNVHDDGLCSRQQEKEFQLGNPRLRRRSRIFDNYRASSHKGKRRCAFRESPEIYGYFLDFNCDFDWVSAGAIQS